MRMSALRHHKPENTMFSFCYLATPCSWISFRPVEFVFPLIVFQEEDLVIIMYNTKLHSPACGRVSLWNPFNSSDCGESK